MKLIDVDELIINILTDDLCGIDNVDKLILNAPIVDAEPVRHGRWIKVDSPGDCCYRCSECGFMRDAYLIDIGNYCPKCGAKMDEEKENKGKVDS